MAFSCKGRGFCPSCGGRRIAERAAHLVDHVFPRVPVRQWVLSVPHRLRYVLAWDHALCRAVVAVAVRATIDRRIRRLLARRGVALDDADGAADLWMEAAPVLAGLAGASIQGRVALGPRAGREVRRAGASAELAALARPVLGPCHAQRNGSSYRHVSRVLSLIARTASGCRLHALSWPS